MRKLNLSDTQRECVKSGNAAVNSAGEPWGLSTEEEA